MDDGMKTPYGVYMIETSPDLDGHWPATVTRQDGQKIRTHDGGTHDSIQVPPSLSEDRAIALAIEMIDKGNLQAG
jgi:hypothetical protein